MSFLNKNKTSPVAFKVTKTMDATKAQSVAESVQIIVSGCTVEELAILAKVVKNPMIKAMALAEAKRVVN